MKEEKRTAIDAFKNGVRVRVRKWGAYVAQHKRPVYERIGCASAGGHFWCQRVTQIEANTGE